MNIVENIERPERCYRLTIYRRSDGHYYFIESKLRQYGDAVSFYHARPMESGVYGTEADIRAHVTQRLAELDKPATLTLDIKRVQLVGMVLLRDWDPIGVCDEPYAQDEYDSYVLPIVKRLLEGSGVGELVEHLGEIQYVRMGMSQPEQPSPALAHAAQRLVDLAISGALLDPP